MTQGVAKDILDRLSQLAVARLDFDSVWQQVANVTSPGGKNFNTGGAFKASKTFWIPEATAARRSKNLYDSTAVWAVDRLGAGMEALAVPQSEYWHGLETTDFRREGNSDAEKLWLERMRNLLFRVRYDAQGGFINAMQTALRHEVAFGNAFVFVEDGIGSRSLITYRYMPLSESYVAQNTAGNIDTYYRVYEMSARQALQKFGDALTPSIKKAAASPKEQDRNFTFVHAIQPRADFGKGIGLRNAPWASVYVDVENQTFISESGYYEFPVFDLRWLPDGVYGEGPVMKALADIQSLQILARNELTASDQAIRPPLLMAHAGVMNRPKTDPGAVNLGGVDSQGRKMIQPLFDGQRLDFATMILEAKRNQVKESLYINLFALLVQNPQMTATEAMIKANEKGELLGPAGSRIQQGLAQMVERELGVLSRKGLYSPGSQYAPPRSLQGRQIGPKFSGPLSRLRRTKEAEGTLRTLETLSPLAQIDPEVVDNFNGDEMTRGLAEIFGMPQKFIRPAEEVAARRDQRAQAQQAAQAAAIAEQAAKASNQGSQALLNLKQTGL